ncbi:MAG: alpha/beta hydrolase, partial [Clostridiales bacterium]|nr:alpha/beta hydrolase [Clostridiales bacterium]
MIVRIGRDDSIRKDIDPSINETLVICDNIDFYAAEYTPVEPTDVSHIAVVLMHCDQNYMGLTMGPALAARGYHVLAIESILSGDIDIKIKRLGRMMKYLRDQDGVEKIVLMGHSGGATLISAYQAIAENGPEVFQRDDMIYKCTLKEKPEAAD